MISKSRIAETGISEQRPFIPPAPKTHPGFVPLWRLVTTTDSLKIWPDFAFEIDFSRRRVLGIETLLLNDPEDIRHVLTANAANWRRPVIMNRIARPLGGEGLFLAEDAGWRRQRRLLAPTFTPAAIDRLVPHFQTAGEHLMRALEGKVSADLSLALQDVALETVLRALFSLPENEARVKLGALGRSYIEGPGHASIFDLVAKNEDDFPFFTRGRRRFQQRWFAAIDAVVAVRRTQPPSAESRDLLDMLLSLRDGETGESLGDAELRDQCATMFFAGSETTARMMFWACYLLTQDLAEQSRLRQEIAAFPPERVSTLDDLQNWPRLRNVLLEALRLYPPIANILRESVDQDELHGEIVPAGAQAWISPWVLHRHKKFWDRPTAFMPDRFAGKSAPWIQMPAYIPFGAGPRICIGLHFALAEAQIVLAHLLSRRQIALAPGKPVMPAARVTTAPSYEPMFALARL